MDGGGVAQAPAVDVEELLPRLDHGDELVVLDVRNDEEFAAWKLEARRSIDTVHVPYFDFIEEPDRCVARVPRGREVVVLCAQGGSSEMVVDLLRAARVAARNVKGGMVAYGDYLEPVKLPLAGGEAARFELWQVNRRGKACLSYVIRAGAEAMVVDPSRRIDWYETFVAGLGASIAQVLDTHVHADHVSGGPALARKLDVPYFVAAGAGFGLEQPVTPLADGTTLRLGGAAGVEVEVRLVMTPGHTPGSTSYLVAGKYLLTGDTLFVAGVGRPDLGGHVVEWGRALFHTLKTTLRALPDETLILPAHYGASAEIAADGVVRGQLGELRGSVPEMRIPTAEEFVEAMRAGAQDPPKAYAEIVKVNLGAQTASPEKIGEWELGKNRCALAMHGSASARPA